MSFYNEYIDLIRVMDSTFDDMLLSRVDDPSSSFYGKCVTFEMLGEVNDLALAARAARFYSCPESKYYHSDAALDIIVNYGKAGMEKFHEDSTCDFMVSNFRTADQFGLENAADGALFMRDALCGKDGEKEAYGIMREIVRRFAEGCVNGGFHTPNHRWVESAGLLMAYDLLRGEEGAERYLEKAKKYLAEGVDCDEYGEWSERSAGMYNRHCDDAFLMIYEETKNPEYLDAVCRNLELMTHYFNDDFSIFSQNSRRKDKGEVGNATFFGKAQTYYAGIYVSSYLKAAYYSGNAKFYAMAKKIYNAEKARGRWNGLVLSPFLRNPELKNFELDISDVKFENTFELYQPKSNIVRKKTDMATYSFLAQNPTFLQISAPGINVGVRMCASFFAVAQFIPDKLEKTDDGYMMQMTAHGEYKLPLENPDESCRDYWSIDYNARGTVQPVDLTLCA
ncbi:MAG: hypothetical protein KBS59_07755, partial [Clostridiales bacterium]|nr:hypothetical protein [Clostridiales bacterium]